MTGDVERFKAVVQRLGWDDVWATLLGLAADEVVRASKQFDSIRVGTWAAVYDKVNEIRRLIGS